MNITSYLSQKKNMTATVAKRLEEKFKRHPDILAEVESWIETGQYISGVHVEGYDALEIHALAPFFDGLGVFSFLVALRENPEAAKKQIAESFPRK